ncbi:hypothetical protein A2Y85_07610 [candidate division WOR-3 bacterium RBG_13_43_14]|uniref:Radical SAM core domain-containing protein n=1 Tax=candidate division WOR-3 bacterium RBG_13_43_14 TaxID=1802590 RepID=A0A1F4UF26_UNCW3|nr:MAG: hypothetical protein A2Y85_07610 [candidate division WOR-3 bacterium RBG_13_43_14]
MKNLFVRSIRWDITNACNLSCMHCYAPKGKNTDIGYDSVIKIIARIMPFGLKEINFSGREPTMRKDIFRIIKWCREKGLTINMTTNGTLMEPIMIRQIINSGINMLVFSLDGPDAETHDKIRGLGNFSKTVENIKVLKSNMDEPGSRSKIGISCTLQKFNINCIQGMIDLCDSLGVDLLAINPVSFCGSALDAVSELYVDSDDIFTGWEEICKRYKKIQPDFEIYLGIYPMEAKYLNLKHNMNLPVIHTGCSAGQTLYINAQGYALPCYMLPPVSDIVVDISKYVKYWDVLNESVQYAASIFEPFINFTVNHNHKNINGCESCPDVPVCKRCPLISMSDPDAVKRCQQTRDRIALTKPKLDPDSVLKIKPIVRHELFKNKLIINIKDGSYTSEKTFELNPFSKRIWNEMSKARSVRQISDTINKRFSKLSPEERESSLLECIDYFLKEGVISIN